MAFGAARSIQQRPPWFALVVAFPPFAVSEVVRRSVGWWEFDAEVAERPVDHHRAVRGVVPLADNIEDQESLVLLVNDDVGVARGRWVKRVHPPSKRRIPAHRATIGTS